MNLVSYVQCDQIGQFLKGFINNFFANLAQVFANFWDNFEK